MDSVQLRPLNVGEIFDRAITLYVRNVVAFSAIAAVLVVPFSLLAYFLFSRQMVLFQSVIEAAGRGSNAPARALLGSPDYALSMGALLLARFGEIVAFVAIAALVGRLYAGGRADWRAAVAAPLRRFPALLGLIVLVALIFIAAIVFVGIAVGLLVGINALLLTYAAPFGVVMLFVTAIVTLALLVSIVLLYFAVGFAFGAFGAEGAPVFAALGSGFNRVFGGGELRRAVLVGLAWIAVGIGTVIVFYGIQMLLIVAHLPAGATMLLQAAFQLVTVPFLSLLVCVYYFDVRTRREGLDVQSGIEALATTP